MDKTTLRAKALFVISITNPGINAGTMLRYRAYPYA